MPRPRQRLLVEHLDNINDEFGEKLAPADNEVTYDEVESAKSEAEDAFHLLVARVMAEFGDDMEAFNEIAEPIRDQSERTRRHFNHRGTIPEVDPETGEPVDPIEETEEEEPQNDGETDTDGETDLDGESETDNETDGEN